jgi:hypothetical protein
MSDWKNINVISCVGGSGEKLSIIEQARADRTRAALTREEPSRRYVLGNGFEVEALDTDRFLLPDTREIVRRA